MHRSLDPTIIAALDPGIRRLVVWLNLDGFLTSDSGDGVSKPDAERWIDEPHVVISLPPETEQDRNWKMSFSDRLTAEADHLASRLRYAGVDFDAEVLDEDLGMDVPAYRIEATYDPVRQEGTIILFGLDDKAFGFVDGNYGPFRPWDVVYVKRQPENHFVALKGLWAYVDPEPSEQPDLVRITTLAPGGQGKVPADCLDLAADPKWREAAQLARARYEKMTP